MIFILSDEGGSVEKVAQKAAEQSELLRAVNLTALRARARKLEAGDVIRIVGDELVVDEDTFGEWVVVSIISPRKDMEALASEIALGLGVDASGMAPGERLEWMGAFFSELKAILEKWQQVRMIGGPGDNMTFEKAAFKKEG